MAKATQCSNKTFCGVASPTFNIGHLKRGLPGSCSPQRNVSVAAKHHENAEPMARALSEDMVRIGALPKFIFFASEISGGCTICREAISLLLSCPHISYELHINF